MLSLSSNFENFYYQRDEKTGHMLRWSVEGSCELSAEFDKLYTFNMSCIQAIIILSISSRNEDDPITYKEIGALFEIDKSKLKENLLPLVKEGPKRILIKTPAVSHSFAFLIFRIKLSVKTTPLK